jgi:outer membrane protein assembly factor BamD (BamD/ComL family)
MNIKEEITIEIATKELYNKAIERLKEKMLDEIAEEIYKKVTAKFNYNDIKINDDTEEGFIGRTD